jgi:hypothetical protein
MSLEFYCIYKEYIQQFMYSCIPNRLTANSLTLFNTYKRVYTTRLFFATTMDNTLFNTYKRVYTTSNNYKHCCLIPIKEYIQQDSQSLNLSTPGCLIPIKEYIQQDVTLLNTIYTSCLIPIKEYIQQAFFHYFNLVSVV